MRCSPNARSTALVQTRCVVSSLTLCANGDVVDTVNSTAFADVDFATMQANVGDAYKFNPTSKFAFSPEFAANRFYKLADTTGRPVSPGQQQTGRRHQRQHVGTCSRRWVTRFLPPTPAAAACTLGAVGSGCNNHGRSHRRAVRRCVAVRNSQHRWKPWSNVSPNRKPPISVACGFRGVRRIGGGWTSASTSAQPVRWSHSVSRTET